jgi:hypothetical protein
MGILSGSGFEIRVQSNVLEQNHRQKQKPRSLIAASVEFVLSFVYFTVDWLQTSTPAADVNQ